MDVFFSLTIRTPVHMTARTKMVSRRAADSPKTVVSFFPFARAACLLAAISCAGRCHAAQSAVFGPLDRRTSIAWHGPAVPRKRWVSSVSEAVCVPLRLRVARALRLRPLRHHVLLCAPWVLGSDSGSDSDSGSRADPPASFLKTRGWRGITQLAHTRGAIDDHSTSHFFLQSLW